MTFNAEKYLGSGAPILALLMGHQCLMTAQVYEHEALWRSGPGPLKYSFSPVHWSSELYDEICVTLAGRAAQQVNICRFSDWHAAGGTWQSHIHLCIMLRRCCLKRNTP
jgi:hypothetical protein